MLIPSSGTNLRRYYLIANAKSLQLVTNLPTTSKNKPLDKPTQDFKHLLMPANLQDVFDHSEEFVLPKVSYLNFEGSRDARDKEQVQSCLLSRIQGAFETHIQEVFEEMSRGEASDAFSLRPPPLHDPQA